MKRLLIMMILALGLMIQSAYPQGKNHHVVFIPKSSDLVFWKFMRQGCDKALQELGNVTLTWRGPAYDDDIDSQIRIVRAYTRPDVDALIIVPTDRERLLEPIRKAAALGIKIIVVDSGLDGNVHRNFIATNNFSAGKLAAKRLVDVLGGEGKVLVLRTVAGSASTDERADGFVDYLWNNAPKIQIVADEHGGGSKGKAQASALALLKKYPDLAGVFAVNEASTDGMLLALRAAGLAGKIKLVGFDSSDSLLAALEKKEISGLMVQNPALMGYLGIRSAVDAINNRPPKEKKLLIEAETVTPENFRNPEIQKLLVP